MSTLAERVREWEADLLEQGIARGIESQRAMLVRQAEGKFGPVIARELASRIAAVTDGEALVLAVDWIIDCDTGTALFERLELIE